MVKAVEDLRNEVKVKVEEKERFINERVSFCDIQGKDKGRFQKYEVQCSMEYGCLVVDLLNKIDIFMIDFMYKFIQFKMGFYIFV